jgi:hypothetical protein
MATNESLRAISMLANADLSANQYRFVNMNTSGNTIAVTAAGERVVGVQQDKAGQQTGAALEASEIGIDGVTLIILGATITAGVEVKSDDEGRAVTAATPALGHYVGGILLTGGVEGDVVSMLIRNYEQATT